MERLQAHCPKCQGQGRTVQRLPASPRIAAHVRLMDGINQGCGYFTLQKLLTHGSAQMTQRYAHLADESLQRAKENSNADNRICPCQYCRVPVDCFSLMENLIIRLDGNGPFAHAGSGARRGHAQGIAAAGGHDTKFFGRNSRHPSKPHIRF